MKTLYLLQNILEPGDILLTRSRGSLSKSIAWGTFGKYSHAALISSTVYKFESDGLGIGYTPIYTNRAEQDEYGLRRLSSLDHVEAAILLRHPRFQHVEDKERLADNLREIVNPFLGFQYPQIHKLATAYSTSPILQIPLGWPLRLYDILKHNYKSNPGPFCSQLVALIYQRINTPLFKRVRSPQTVSPNSLRRSIFYRSLLLPVNGAICDPDYSKSNNDSLVSELNKMLPSREEVLAPLVRAKAFLTDITPFVQEFSVACDKAIEFLSSVVSESDGKDRSNS